MFALGWRWYGGYIGGPRALNTWANSDFGTLARAGFVFVPYYVGRTDPWDDVASLTWDDGFADGLDADNLAGAAGFDSNQPIALDMEYGDLEAGGQAFIDYVDGWCAAVHDAGHPTIGYGDPYTIEAIGSHFDQTIMASYVTKVNYQTPPWGKFDPASPPPSDAWQFSDSGKVAGVPVDQNSAGDGFQFATYTPPA